MSTCLRCDGDGCSKTITEHEGDLRKWWRLERYAFDNVPEIGMPGRPSPMSLPMTTFSVIPIHVLTDAEFGEPSDEEIEAMQDRMVEEEEFFDCPVLHFCSAACLATWASQADVIEG